ncbi:MAG: flagellar biosynthesis protein FlhA [Planctomycetota bacterium]
MSTAAATPATPTPGSLGSVLRFMDVALGFGVIGVVFVLVVPIPTPLLDVLLCCQMALSLAILLGTLHTPEPLEFSGFPPLLLIITLFRLALDVAASRLILLNGNAGTVISSFGQFVVGGNYVVGVTIFLILIVIQFVVITKGAGRVAEVAARFTLDAMPGKQMAIDADLNAGVIDEGQARQRRHKIERESAFYGAMDGASKFVRGDAVAAMIIAAVNLLGGLAIGVLMQGKSPAEAMHTYALLSIGSGLVTQIPALLVSTACGILVTRGASEMSLGEDMSRQVLMRSRAMKITAAFMGILALIPGLPAAPLLTLGAAAWVLGILVGRTEVAEGLKKREAALAEAKAPGGRRAPSPDSLEAQLRMDVLELELGASLLSMVDRSRGDLLGRIAQLRKKLAAELGIIIPAVRVRDNLQLGGRQYLLKVRGAVVAEHEVYLDRLLAINPGNARPGLEGLPSTDPAFGLSALWIPVSQRARAEAYGYTVVETVAVVATHLHELLRANAAELLTRHDVQGILDRVKDTDPALVKDLVPGAVSLSTLHRVLQGLLRERVPVRDAVTILETLGDFAGQQKSVEALIEEVRAALAPSFVGSLLDEKGRLIAVACEPALESRLLQSLIQTEGGQVLILTPSQVSSLVKHLGDQVAASVRRRQKVVLVCSDRLRVQIRRLIERALPVLPVLSYAEVPPRAILEIVAQVPETVLGPPVATMRGVAAAEKVK